MKKINLLLCVAAALMGAGCSSDDLLSIDETTTQTDADQTPINFSTYVGQPKDTRAGTGGDLTTTELQTTGFGIFVNGNQNSTKYDSELYGPYTGKYSEISNSITAGGCNVLENIPVKYADSKWGIYGSSTGATTDAQTLYWPNPSKKYDGTVVPQYLSFFAYAPYVEKPSTEDTYGIMGISHAGALAGESGSISDVTLKAAVQAISYKSQDPVIHYTTVPGKDGKVVDLLWGTSGSNGTTYDGTAQAGSTVNGKGLAGTRSEDVMGAGNVNMDLQKMTSDGTVAFNFKHALAKIGGINGVKAAVTGGEADVYINWVAIELTGKNSSNGTVDFPTEGYFNLVTGKWATEVATTGTKPIVYTIGISGLYQEAKTITPPEHYWVNDPYNGWVWADSNGDITTPEQYGLDDNAINYLRYRYNLGANSGLTGLDSYYDEIKDIQKKGHFFGTKGNGVISQALTSALQNVAATYTKTETNQYYYCEANGYYEDGTEDATGTEHKKPSITDTYPSTTVEYSSEPAYIIPSASLSKGAQAKVIVNYRQGAGNVTQTATVDLPELGANKSYELDIWIGTQSINVTAAVENWSDITATQQTVNLEPKNGE